MQKTRLFIALIIIIQHTVAAQLADVPPVGPVSLGLGGISAPLDNGWSIFNNPAGLSSTESINSVFGYQTIFNFAPFNTVAAAINVPTSIGTASLGAYRFGDRVFSSQMASLGFARKVGIMGLGIKANVLQYNIDGFGTRTVFIAEMGCLATLSPVLTFGMHIYNFTQAVIAKETYEKVPTIIRLAVDYHPTDALNLFIEAEKDVIRAPNLKLGLAYRVVEALELRTGFSMVNKNHAFGAGFKINRFMIDYGVKVNTNAGATHNFGLNFMISD